MSFWKLNCMFTNFSKCFEEKFDQRFWFELRNKAKENDLVWTYFKEQFWCLDEISQKAHFRVGILVINKLKKFFVRVIFVPPRNQSKLKRHNIEFTLHFLFGIWPYAWSTLKYQQRGKLCFVDLLMHFSVSPDTKFDQTLLDPNAFRLS